jgi:hypothetical protein
MRRAVDRDFAAANEIAHIVRGFRSRWCRRGRGLRSLFERRSDHHGERGRDTLSRTDHHSGSPAQATRDLLRSVLRG